MNEAQRKGPCRVREGSRELVRDSSGDSIFHERLQHIPVNDPKEEEEDANMVRRHNIKIGHYFLDVQTLGDRPPPLHSRAPPTTGGRKRPRTFSGFGDQTEPSTQQQTPHVAPTTTDPLVLPTTRSASKTKDRPAATVAGRASSPTPLPLGM